VLKKNSLINKFNRIPARNKLLFVFAISLLVFLLLSQLGNKIEFITRLMISWNSFSLLWIAFSIFTFFTMKPRQIRLLVQNQDSSRRIVFFIVVISTVCSLLGVLFLLIGKGHWVLNKYIVSFIYINGVIFSWLLLHIMFTFRYAHLYYHDEQFMPEKSVPALNIPNEPNPDYLDFAYFSFIIGMTFQVSDININSRHIRRLALLHGLLSFLFNTVIVALSINVIIDLKP